MQAEMQNTIYRKILQKYSEKKKMLAVLIDPDKTSPKQLSELTSCINTLSPDFVFVGGSLIFQSVEKTIDFLKKGCTVPVILFPGNMIQFSEKADALLYLTLISGRNPEFLIGQHVVSSYQIKKSGIEIISTGYILIDGGKKTSVGYMSNTESIPRDKPEITVATAIAGEQIGNKLIYLEAGSGALYPVPEETITSVKRNIDIPIIVGGGICTVQDIRKALNAGADIIVTGNILEKDPELLASFVTEVRKGN